MNDPTPEPAASSRPGADEELLEPAGPGVVTQLRQALTSTPSMTVAAVLFVVMIVLVLLGPLLPFYDPTTQNLSLRNSGFWTTGPESFHLLGADALGRDLFSRLILGGRMSLLIAGGAVLISVLIGSVLGVAAGYFGGAVDSAIMGLGDLQLAIPRILLVIAVVAVVGPSVPNLVLLLGITSWVLYGRVVRALTLTLREREFTLASIVMGGSAFWIIRRHIVPHTVGQLIIMGSFDLGNMVMLEAALSYLGLGVQPPTASWGLMINEAEAYITTNPWLVVLPGVAIFMLVASTNVLTQALTDESNAVESTSGV